MSEDTKDAKTRRTFLKSSATAGAALAVANRAPAVLASTGESRKLRVAMIGVGTQGHGLINAVQNASDTEIRVICDLHTGNIKRAQSLCTNPNVRIVKEWERVVEDKDIDAVVIATWIRSPAPLRRPCHACRAIRRRLRRRPDPRRPHRTAR